MTALYREVTGYCRDVRQPGAGWISDGASLHASPDGKQIVIAAVVAEQAEAEPPTRLALIDLATGDTKVVTSGPNSDKLPKFSVDGRQIAFLSDRQEAGRFQLYLFDCSTGIVRPGPPVEGSAESLQWSVSGKRILLNVVETRHPRGRAEDLPSGMPAIDPPDQPDHWRSCWIYDLASDSVRRVAAANCSIWEASWCGEHSLVAVASDRPDEGCWFSARLHILDTATGACRDLYAPMNQIGVPAASPSGRTIAVVEALCSDRGPVLGDLLLIDATSGTPRRVDTRDIDIATVEWQSERHLLVSGTRGLETVAGLYDTEATTCTEIWSSPDLSIGGNRIAGLAEPGDCALIVESFMHAPQVAVVRDHRFQRILSLDIGYAEATKALAAAERIGWSSADGLEIEGWLLRPHGPAPYPLILNIHGGPLQTYCPAILVRKLLHLPLLLSRGFAVFLPNPRGSSGRGSDFARRVIGDLGGGDAQDLLCGLDALIDRGLACPGRIGVTGVSYGGFMTSWLITQSDRFSAAVAVSPHTNHVTAQLLSNVGQFMATLVSDDMSDPGGRYYARSPVLQVRKRLAPTLNIGGGMDRITPPGEAMQFHAALTQAGSRSVLVIYPEEGHGIRRMPAALDCAARIAAWFIENIPASAVVQSQDGAIIAGIDGRRRTRSDRLRSPTIVDQGRTYP